MFSVSQPCLFFSLFNSSRVRSKLLFPHTDLCQFYTQPLSVVRGVDFAARRSRSPYCSVDGALLRPSRIFNPFSRSSGCKHLFFDISSCWRAPASRQQLAGGRRGTRRAWLICCSSLRCLPFSSLFFGRVPLRNLAPRVLLASIPSTLPLGLFCTRPRLLVPPAVKPDHLTCSSCVVFHS